MNRFWTDLRQPLLDQVDEHEGDNIVATIFGGNNSTAVASALAGKGASGGKGNVIGDILGGLLGGKK